MLLSLEQVAVSAGHKVLMEFDDNNALIVCDPDGILGQQLRLQYSILLLLLF
jgi:hypothetical protein